MRGNARRLRHDATDAERAMWRLLRQRRLAEFKFRRQMPFNRYILDFVCLEQKIVVETDGSQHASSPRDAARDSALAAQGFRVLHYWNNDVLQRPMMVLEDLFNHLSGNNR
jgi:very-short-patch-repair endonuclease